MKVTLNGMEMLINDIALVRDELPLLNRLGNIDYINYLRVYKDMDVNPIEE